MHYLVCLSYGSSEACKICKVHCPAACPNACPNACPVPCPTFPTACPASNLPVLLPVLLTLQPVMIYCPTACMSPTLTSLTLECQLCCVGLAFPGEGMGRWEEVPGGWGEGTNFGNCYYNNDSMQSVPRDACIIVVAVGMSIRIPVKV